MWWSGHGRCSCLEVSGGGGTTDVGGGREEEEW